MKSGLLSLLLCLVIPVATQGRDPLVHVSLAKENRIITYRMSGDDGTLTLVDSLPVEGGPGALAFHPTTQRPFIAYYDRSNKKIKGVYANEDDFSTKPTPRILALNYEAGSRIALAFHPSLV